MGFYLNFFFFEPLLFLFYFFLNNLLIYFLFLGLSIYLILAFFSLPLFNRSIFWHKYLGLFAFGLIFFYWFTAYVYSNNIMFYLNSLGHVIFFSTITTEIEFLRNKYTVKFNFLVIFLLQNLTFLLWWSSLFLILLGKENVVYFLIEHFEIPKQEGEEAAEMGRTVGKKPSTAVQKTQHTQSQVTKTVPPVLKALSALYNPIKVTIPPQQIIPYMNVAAKGIVLNGSPIAPINETVFTEWVERGKIPIPTPEIKKIIAVVNGEIVTNISPLPTEQTEHAITCAYNQIKGDNKILPLNADNDLKISIKCIGLKAYWTQIYKGQNIINGENTVAFIEADTTKGTPEGKDGMFIGRANNNTTIKAPGEISEIIYNSHQKNVGNHIERPKNGESGDWCVNGKIIVEVKTFVPIFNKDLLEKINNNPEESIKALEKYIEITVDKNLKQNLDKIKEHPTTIWAWNCSQYTTFLKDSGLSQEELIIMLNQKITQKCEENDIIGVKFQYFGHMATTENAFFFTMYGKQITKFSI